VRHMGMFSKLLHVSTWGVLSEIRAVQRDQQNLGVYVLSRMGILLISLYSPTTQEITPPVHVSIINAYS
jgi:hypothetical protein